MSSCSFVTGSVGDASKSPAGCQREEAADISHERQKRP
jgi:hypothetical protein